MMHGMSRHPMAQGGLAILAVLILGGCQTAQPTGPVYGDIQATDPGDVMIRDRFFDTGFRADRDYSAEDPVEPRLFAVVEVLQSLYADEMIRAGFVQQALANEDTVRSLIEGQGLTADRSDQIFAALNQGAQDLPVDVFLDLPAVVDLVNDLDDRLVPLGTTEADGG